jgi:hypothetical protein
MPLASLIFSWHVWQVVFAFVSQTALGMIQWIIGGKAEAGAVAKKDEPDRDHAKVSSWLAGVEDPDGNDEIESLMKEVEDGFALIKPGKHSKKADTCTVANSRTGTSFTAGRRRPRLTVVTDIPLPLFATKSTDSQSGSSTAKANGIHDGVHVRTPFPHFGQTTPPLVVKSKLPKVPVDHQPPKASVGKGASKKLGRRVHWSEPAKKTAA